MRDRRLYTYVLRFDDGAAPNPFGGICSLAICKPYIRSTAQIGDWIIGTGSVNSQIAKKNFVNLSDSVVYAMKVTNKMTLEKYNEYCKEFYLSKIPNRDSTEWIEQMGDCIYYDFSTPLQAKIRKGVHDEKHMARDLKGRNVLLSNNFYYFGLAAKKLPLHLRLIIKKGRGYKITLEQDKIKEFDEWISQFEQNMLYANPQLMWQQIDRNAHCQSSCSHSEYLEKQC